MPAFLVSLGVASTICALAYGLYFTHRDPSGLRSFVKTASTALIATACVVGDGPPLLVMALGLGAVGDYALSRDHDRGFLPGLVAFLLGHLCYVGLFASAGLLARAGLPSHDSGLATAAWQLWRLFPTALLILFAIGAVILFWPRAGKLRLPVAGYIVVITAMGLAAIQLPPAWPMGMAIFGAALFIVSDAILGYQLFLMNDHSCFRRLSGVLLWIFYWTGQAMIAFAFVNGFPRG